MKATAPFENHNVRMGSEQQPPIPAQSIHFVKMAADVSKSTSSWWVSFLIDMAAYYEMLDALDDNVSKFHTAQEHTYTGWIDGEHSHNKRVN